MPDKLWIYKHQINGHFLRPNSIRVGEIASQILEEEYDVISLQEAFDEASVQQFIDKLSPKYPYIVHDVRDKTITVGSGLLIFSKYPILDAEFHPYTNAMYGEETIANKGFLACKIQVSPGHFITVYNTHVQSGGGIFKDWQAWLAGTTSARRGVQFGKIADHMQTWEKVPPLSYQQLSHLSTHLTGDLNTGLNNARSMLAISASMSNNGFKNGNIKYAGQHKLFSRFNLTTPVNFIDVRAEPSNERMRKPNDEKKVQQSIAEDLFTGTAPTEAELKKDMSGKSEVSRRSNRKLIDAMHVSNNSNPNAFFSSRIISFGNSTDHFAIQGELTCSLDEKENLNKSDWKIVPPSA